MPLEELNRPLVLLCSFAAFESAEIPPPAGLWIFLARIKPKLTGCKLANHKTLQSAVPGFIIAHPPS